MSKLQRLTTFLVVGAFVTAPFSSASASFGDIAVNWFNGYHQNEEIWDYSTSFSNPNYGTHDWIANHAVSLLPEYERKWIENNWDAFLLGTEAPDNEGLDYLGNNTGYGDFSNHEILFNAQKSVVFDGAAKRTQEEFNKAAAQLPRNERLAAYYAGTMTHYIADLAAYPHVMGEASHRGKERYHHELEEGVSYWTHQYNGGGFEKYLSFNGSLDVLSPYSAAINVAKTTDFGYGATMNAAWMNNNIPVRGKTFYLSDNATFTNSVGDSLNRAVNTIADVLHTLSVQQGYVLERMPSSQDATRFDTAIQVSKRLYPEKNTASSVILVNAYQFIDAIAAAPLAKQENGVLLLTDAAEITPKTLGELDRLLPNSSRATVYLIGGTSVISEEIQDYLTNNYEYTIKRIGTLNRYDTSAQIAKELTTTNSAFLAETYAVDAIAASGVAAKNGYPVLLTKENDLSSEVQNFLEDHAKGQAIERIYILGGTRAISTAVEIEVEGLGIEVVRIAGTTDRYDTAKKIAEYFYDDPIRVIIANGHTMIDVLAGSVLAGESGIPILLTNTSWVPSATSQYINAHAASLTRGYVFGGTSVVPYSQERSIGELISQ